MVSCGSSWDLYARSSVWTSAAPKSRRRSCVGGCRSLGRARPPRWRRRSCVERFTAATDGTSPEACVGRGRRLRRGDCSQRPARVDGIGVGVASTVDFAAGRVVHSVNLPLRTCRLRDVLRQSLGCRSPSTTTPPRRPSASTSSAPAVGDAADAHAHARHRRGRRHHLRTAAPTAASAAPRPSSGTSSSTSTGPSARPTAPITAVSRRTWPGRRWARPRCAEAEAPIRPRPSAAPWPPARRSTAACSRGSAGAATRRRRRARARGRRRCGVGLTTLVNIFNPEIDRRRRRRGGGGRAAAGAGPPRDRRARAPAGARPGPRRAGRPGARTPASSAPPPWR